MRERESEKEGERVVCRLMDKPGSAKVNGKEPKTCLGRVFHYKIGHFEDVYETQVCRCTPTSVVVNSAQVSSC
jgi:hypothetical protein